MNLIYEELLHPIVLEEDLVNVVVLENKLLFRRFAERLIMQADGIGEAFLLDVNGKTCSLAKKLAVVINPFSLEINSRKTLTKLYDVLTKRALDEENFARTMELKSLVLDFTYSMLQLEEWPIVIDEDFNIGEIFKMTNARFDNGGGDLVERIAQYMAICKRFLGIEIIAFFNLKTYLTEAEIQELYVEARYKKLQLLLIESSMSEKLTDEKIYLVDNDLCEVVVD